MIAQIQQLSMTAPVGEEPVLELSSLDFRCPLALVYEEVELMASAEG